MKSNDYGKIYFLKQQSYKDKSFSPLQEINSNFDLLKSIEIGTGRAIGVTSNDELLEWKYEKKGTNQKRQEFPFLLCKPVYHFHKIKFAKVLMNKTMCLGLDTNGYVLVWGEHKDGLLGLGYTITAIENPTRIECLKDICEIALSDNHAIVINSSGDAFSWGTGKYGELGLEKSIYTPTPLRVNGTRIYSRVIVGNLITCFLDTEGHFSYFGVIIKILKGCFSTITVKNLLTDQSNSDPNTLFQEKIIDELENEQFVNVSIGNGFIALLSKKGTVYTLEYSDKLTLLYSKYFVYSLTVSNNQIFGLSYDKYCNNQSIHEQTSQINQQLYFLCQWISKATDQEVSNEIWLTMIYRITEELHLDNILLINTNNRNLILFLEKGMNLNTTVLFPNRNNVNISHDISWDNITYNELPVGSLGLMKKNTQNQHFLVFDSEYDDSYNMKFKRTKLIQGQRNTSPYLNRTMLSDAKSSMNILPYNKSICTSNILGALSERNNKRLFSTDSSNKKLIHNEDESVDMKEKELQHYQKEIDNIISNIKFRQKEKSSNLKQKYKDSQTFNMSFNTERGPRHNSLNTKTLPNSMNQKFEMIKSNIEQADNKNNPYNNLDTSNPNIDTKNNISDIDGLFNKTNNENSNNNTEIRNDMYSDVEEVNIFNKSNCNILDESNQLKLSSNYVYVNPNKSNFLSPQFIKTNKMSQLYTSKESLHAQLKEGKLYGNNMEDEDFINKNISNSEYAGTNKMKLKSNKLYNSMGNDNRLMNDYYSDTNDMKNRKRSNTFPFQNKRPYSLYHRSLSLDSGLNAMAAYYHRDLNRNSQNMNSPTQLIAKNIREGLQHKYTLSHGYKKENYYSINKYGKQMYEIDEEDCNFYQFNDARRKYLLMNNYEDNQNNAFSDRAHYVPLRKNIFNLENDFIDAQNKGIKSNNNQNAIRKLEDLNKMSTILNMESSNFNYSSENIFEDQLRHDVKNSLFAGKEIKSKSKDKTKHHSGNKKSQKKTDNKFDNKSNIADSSDNEGEGYQNYEKQSQKNRIDQSNQLIKTNKDMQQMYNRDNEGGNNEDFERDNQQQYRRNNENVINEEEEDEYKENHNENEEQAGYNNDFREQRNEDVFIIKSKSNFEDKNQKIPTGRSNKKSPSKNTTSNQNQNNLQQSNNSNKKSKKEDDINNELKQYITEQENNLVFSFDPALMKQQILHNKSNEKDKKMKDYDDIINEVKKDDSFRKAFSPNRKVDNSNSKMDFNSREEDESGSINNDIKSSSKRSKNNILGQSDDDLRIDNYDSNKGGNTKKKRLISDKERINEDEGSYDDEEDDDDGRNPQGNRQSQHNSKRTKKGNKNELMGSNSKDNNYINDSGNKKSSLNQKNSSNEKYHTNKSQTGGLLNKDNSYQGYDDLSDSNGKRDHYNNDKDNRSNDKRTNKKSLNSSGHSYNNEENDDIRTKNKNSGRKPSDGSNQKKKKNNQIGNSNDEEYDENVQSPTNVFKYASNQKKLNRNELNNSNSNNNDTARLGQDDDEKDGYRMSFTAKDKSNRQLKSSNNQDYLNNLLEHKKSKDQLSKEEALKLNKNIYDISDDDDDSTNKNQFKQLLNQQKNYLSYQQLNNKGEIIGDNSIIKDGMTSQERKLYQNGKRKPNEINTDNPYNEEFNKHKKKNNKNKKEYSPSENSSVEANRHLNHLYQKKFGANVFDNRNIHHNRVSSQPVSKGMIINPEDTFGPNDSNSFDKDQSMKESNRLKQNRRVLDKQGLKGEEYQDKRMKNNLLIKIPSDESIIDLHKKGLNSEEEDDPHSSRKNNAGLDDNNNNNGNLANQKIFTLKGYSNEKNSNCYLKKGNAYDNDQNNKLAQYMENKEINNEDSATKPTERIAQLITKIKKNQSQIEDSMTHNEQLNQRKEEDYDSQSSHSIKLSNSNPNNENVYTFSGNQAGASQMNNKKGFNQTKKQEHISESVVSNSSKSELLNQNQNRKEQYHNKNSKESSNKNKKNQYSSSTLEEGKISTDPNNLFKNSREKQKKQGYKKDSLNNSRKMDDDSINNRKKIKNNKNQPDTPSSERGERSSLVSLLSESKAIKGKDEFNSIAYWKKHQGGKFMSNKNFLNYFCFLVIDYMKKKVALNCIGKIYYYQLNKEKNYACKILFRLMRKRVIFYKIKFYHRVVKIYKFLLKNK